MPVLVVGGVNDTVPVAVVVDVPDVVDTSVPPVGRPEVLLNHLIVIAVPAEAPVPVLQLL